jgi:TonB family protein
MKYCPACQTKYDEEILRFCTKDGTPLIDENQPNFTELPSESAGDDYGEETVIRRKNPEPIPELDPESGDYITKVEPAQSSQRIVIPTTEEEKQQIRTKTTPSVRSVPPPRESNTAIVVLLTVIGTVVVLSAATGIFWILSNQNSSENQNINTNINSLNENINANPDADNSLFDFNSNSNSNTNINTNSNANVNTSSNTKTPTPTPSPSPTPTPSPTPDNENNTNTNSNITTPTPRPSLTPRPSQNQTPPPPAETPSNSPVNAGILNDRALNLQTPSYPPIARETRASGRVQVLVTLDENGNVNSAKAVSGNPLLRSPAENAARNSKFSPVKVSGKNVKATGFVIYNFVKPN